MSIQWRTGTPTGDAKLDECAKTIRGLLDAARDRIQALGKGQLADFYENYFPHIWKDPTKAEQVNLTGKKFQKSPAFLKQRTVETIKQGLAAGLVPVTTNPVELVMLKLHEMNRYEMGQRVLAEGKSAGYIKLARSYKDAPDGWVKIDSRDRFSCGRRPTVKADGSEGAPEYIPHGDYYAQPDAGRVLNNYLSPGLHGWALYDALRYGSNMLNQANLDCRGSISPARRLTRLSLGWPWLQSSLQTESRSMPSNRPSRLLPHQSRPLSPAVRSWLRECGPARSAGIWPPLSMPFKPAGSGCGKTKYGGWARLPRAHGTLS